MKKKVESKNIRKNRRKRNILPVVVLAIGFIAGAILIGFGIYNNATSDYSILAIKSEDELKKEVDNKIEEVKKLREERDEEFSTSALSEKYYEISRSITTAEGELSDLEAELYNVKNGVYDGLKGRTISSSAPLIVGGVVLIILGAGLFTYLNNRQKQNKILSVNEA